jgi:hypothetical protein
VRRLLEVSLSDRSWIPAAASSSSMTRVQSPALAANARPSAARSRGTAELLATAAVNGPVPAATADTKALNLIRQTWRR